MINSLKSAPEGYFCLPAHPASGGCLLAFSSRADGNMSLCYGDTRGVTDNRRSFLGAAGIDHRDLVCAKQVHGTSIAYVGRADAGRGALDYADSIEGTDAFITDEKGLPLAIFSADCLVICLYDPARPALALIHSGWRSAKVGIISGAISLMKERFGTLPSNIMAAAGPAIGGCCYDVGEEFKDFFPRAVSRRRGRYFMDLSLFAEEEFLRQGVSKENIHSSGVCTSCNNRDFFSYRREGSACGRMMAVAALR